MKKFMPLGLVFLFSLFIFVSRVLPHEANWSPALALCLFAGFMGRGSWYSLVLPVTALFLSDLYLGFYPGWAINSISYVATLVIGAKMSERYVSAFGSGLVASLLFFFISNLGVWMYSGLYSLSFDGLMQCFRLALPFFRTTLVSTLSFVTLFFFASRAYKLLIGEKRGERVPTNG